MVDEKKIRKGYKKTEIGVIPKDWKVITIGEIFDFKNGLNKAKIYFGEGTPIINYMDVNKNRGITRNHIKGKVTVTKDEIQSFNVKQGDVFFTRTSETIEEIGFSSVLLEDIENSVFSGFILRGRPMRNELLDNYKKYCFFSESIRKEIISKATYTTRALTNGKVLSKIEIPIPPLKEQKFIAAVLTDVDNLIEYLEMLIDKKKKIKQGTMQQLITGKKRLPGFSGEWEVKKLGDICHITTGKLDANAMIKEGKYRFYTCAKDFYKIDIYAFNTEALLVSGNGANVGYIHYYKGKFNAYQRTYVLSNFREDIKYVKLFMDIYLKYRIESEVNAGNTPYIKMDTLTEMDINMPIKVCEQKAIAQILSDMDAEIESLEQKLSKYKTIKQGMMQELLTGRIRLI